MVGDTDSLEVSRILRAERVDTERLLPLVYEKLRAIAARRMAGERPGHTLQATALVNEAYLKLVAQDDLGWESKAHFYAAAAQSMRRILIDYARACGAAKRGGGALRLPLDVLDLAARENLEEVVSVDEAVSRLEKRDKRMAEIIKLRFYAGLPEQEVAKILGVTGRTVRNDWALARAWLRRELAGE
jgi:RNA polymerase sigma factor (TIGR02999 family)